MFYQKLVGSHVRPFAPREYLLLQLMVFFLFFGRAWQAFFFSIPLEEVFWDEYWLHDIVELLTGNTWEHYVRTSESFIILLQRAFALVWLVCAGLTWSRLDKRWAVAVWWSGTGLLWFLFFLYFKEMFWSWGQLFEYASQAVAPIFLYSMYRYGLNTPAYRFGLQLTIATTFFCHGLYAYGYYPQPAVWVDWCIYVFFMSEDTARLFLWWVGVFDMLKLVIIFIPFKPLQWLLLWYCLVWGFMTALARVVSTFSPELPIDTLFQYTPEMLFRLVHGGLPLLLWWAWYGQREELAQKHS